MGQKIYGMMLLTINIHEYKCICVAILLKNKENAYRIHADEYSLREGNDNLSRHLIGEFKDSCTFIMYYLVCIIYFILKIKHIINWIKSRGKVLGEIISIVWIIEILYEKMLVWKEGSLYICGRPLAWQLFWQLIFPRLARFCGTNVLLVFG